MRLLELSFDDPQTNLALDEALLLYNEQRGEGEGVLRLWEPATTLVVVGRGSALNQEVHLDVCCQRQVPVLRRCSGGAAIVTGPGCLMYSLIFRHAGRSSLPAVNEIHASVLDQLVAALSTSECVVVRSGTSDLAIVGPDGLRKFSGNSLRVCRNWVLYHGTCLYAFPLNRITELLAMPPRMPDYRQARSHSSFLCNLPLGRQRLRQHLIAAFQAGQATTDWPRELTAELVASRYSQPSWNEGARR